MYEELVKNLRICSICNFGQNCDECTQKSEGRFCCDILLHKAADAIEDLQNERDMYSKAMIDEHNKAAKIVWEHRWIPVSERLPEESGEYLVWANVRPDKDEDPVPFMIMSYFHAFYDNQFIVKNVSHWMPLPEPPKEDKNGNS